MEQLVTIFRDVLDTKTPFYITVDEALLRIKSGKSKEKIDVIRAEQNKDKRNELKTKLPCVLFSGEFFDRSDKSLKRHSGFVILDFDHVADVDQLKINIFAEDFCYAAWRSPSGDGVKALVQIKNPEKHRAHYLSLLKYFKEKGINTDEKNCNESRVCYESEDLAILVKKEVVPYDGIEEPKTYIQVNNSRPTQKLLDERAIYDKLKIWMSKRGDLFIEGNRNNFLAKFSAALNRFGVSAESTISFLSGDFLHGSTFSISELERTVHSIYRNYSTQYNTSYFEDSRIINPNSTSEAVFDVDMKIKDLVRFQDVWDNMNYRLKHGSPRGESTYFNKLDNHFRFMRRETTLWHGFGNVGKTSFVNQLLLVQSVFKKYRWAVFSPENSPADYYYQDLAEMYCGKPFSRFLPDYATDEEIDISKKFINEHFYYLYPKDDSPTPDYMMKCFMETIIKHKIDGIIIDPFNQLIHDRGKNGRDDLYLETILTKFKRFTQNNDIFFHIVAHPNKPEKSGAKKYDEPDMYSIAGGAMWPNKMDNINCYHRPDFFIDPTNTWCTLTSQKIKKQRQNGIPGKVDFKLNRHTMRFMEFESEPTFENENDGYNPLETLNPAKDVKYTKQEVLQDEEDNSMPF